MASTYPNQRFSTYLGLSLYGMDEVLAENMNIIDAAYGAGSSINVNGTFVSAPNLSNNTPAPPGGKTNVTWQFDSSGNISAYVSTSSGGGVTSITGDGSLITNSASTGDVTLTLGNQSANTALMGPASGVATVPTFRAIVAGDIPTLNQNTTGTAANLSGTPTLPNGTAATTQSQGNNSTDLATTAYVDTGLATKQASFGNQTANTVYAGPASGIAAAPTFRAVVAGDIPTLNQNTSGTAANLSGTPALPNGTTATTQTASDNSTKLATTAYVDSADSLLAPKASPTFTGTVILPATTQSGTDALQQTTAATSGANQNSPALTIGGTVWNGAASANDVWTIQDVVGAGTNGTSTLLHTQAGSTGQAALAVGNATVATSGTTNASPFFSTQANYWTGAASAIDQWNMYSSLAAGSNGASTLNFTHSGTTGALAISNPGAYYGPSGTAGRPTYSFASNVSFGMYFTSQHLNFSCNGNATFSVTQAGSTYHQIASSQGYGWSSTAASTGTFDTGISRPAGGVISIDTTTFGNTAGTLKAGTIIEATSLSPTSAATAGTTGQIAWDSGKIYVCTVGGAAGSATWKAATLSAV